MGISIQKTGIIPAELHSEFIANAFDTTTYVEPDGSCWIRIAHHNHPDTSRFDANDPFDSQVYKSQDVWFNVALCNLLSNSWELMIKQKTTDTATEAKYRWIQTINPMTTNAFEQTKAANVTKITTSGYSNPTSYGGCYILNTSSTYLCCNNSTNGNWFGAFGCKVLYQGGLPGYAGVIVSSGYMDLYLRMNSKSNLNQASIGPNFMKTHEFIEVY